MVSKMAYFGYHLVPRNKLGRHQVAQAFWSPFGSGTCVHLQYILTQNLETAGPWCGLQISSQLVLLSNKKHSQHSSWQGIAKDYLQNYFCLSQDSVCKGPRHQISNSVTFTESCKVY